MGHIHLATLPSSKPWGEVVRLLNERAPTDAVMAASARAAEKDLARAAGDPALAEAVRLLAMIPHAARSPNFADGLRALGVDVPDAPMLADLTVGMAGALDRSMAQTKLRTDFSEMVRRAALGTLSTLVGDQLPEFFDADASDVRRAAARLGRPEEFARASRAFFGRLLADTLGSWLDRTLSAEIGPGSRMESFGQRERFDRGLEEYCVEATRSIRESSSAWYGKALYQDGAITSARAVGFSAFAMRKIGEELRRQRADA